MISQIGWRSRRVTGTRKRGGWLEDYEPQIDSVETGNDREAPRIDGTRSNVSWYLERF